MGKVIAAHFAAVFAGAIAITAGFGAIQLESAIGILDGALKGIGGFLIWAILALLSLPLSALARLLLIRTALPVRPTVMAISLAVSFTLMPVLHPGLSPVVSLGSHPFQLMLIHGCAGILAGLAWLCFDHPESRTA